MIRWNVVAELTLVAQSIGESSTLIRQRLEDWNREIALRRLASDPVLERLKMLGTLAVEPGGPLELRKLEVSVACYAASFDRAIAAFEQALTKTTDTLGRTGSGADPFSLTISKLDCCEAKKRSRR